MAHLRLYSRGGVGNQMFQYAFARHMQTLTGLEIEVKFRDTVPRGHRRERRVPELLNFNLDSSTKVSDSRFDHLSWRLISLLSQIQSGSFSKLARMVCEGMGFITDAQGIEPSMWSRSNNLRLFGYWISRDFFFQHQSLLRECFSLRGPLPPRLQEVQSAAEATEEESIAIHVRRGDYFSKGLIETYGILTEDYYIEALKLAMEKPANNYQVFIFTDDSHWVENNLLPKLPNSARYRIVDQKPPETAAEHLALMSSFTRLILSNSTFSWWGATLGPEKKVVVSPTNWGPSFGEANLLSEDWLLVNN